MRMKDNLLETCLDTLEGCSWRRTLAKEMIFRSLPLLIKSLKNEIDEKVIDAIL